MWAKIAGLPDRYRVSTSGLVKTEQHTLHVRGRNGVIYSVLRPEKILKPFANNAKGGYLQVTLSFSEDGVTKVVSGKVHRLVAQAFIPNPGGLGEVNHIDSNKHNNDVSNLEWVTRSDNILHNYASGTRKKHKKITPVAAFPVDGLGVVREFPSMLAATESGEFTLSGVHYAVKHNSEHRGYFWRTAK